MLDKQVLRYYTSLSMMPSTTQGAVILYLGIALAIVGLNVVFNPSVYVFVLHTLLLSFFPLFLVTIVPFFNIKRACTLGALSLAPTLPLEVLGAITNVYGLCYAALPLIPSLVVRGVSGKNRRSVTIALYAAIAEALFVFTERVDIPDVLIRAAILGTALGITYSIAQQIRIVGERRGRDLFRLAYAWSRLILAQDGSELEKFFNAIAREESVRVRALVFKRDDGSNIALIVPEVHFGPFRYLGSSALPYQIEQRLPPQFRAFVLHGAGSHERNASHSLESERLAAIIADALQHHTTCRGDVYSPMRVSDGVREALVIPTAQLILIAISNPTTGGDDLPYEVQREADAIANAYGYAGAVIVDCHNLEGKLETDYRKFIPLLRSALSRTPRPCHHLAVGYGEGHAPLVRGLCNSKVKALVIECDSKRYALIYLYGNNAKLGVRTTIRRLLIDRGFSDVEVVTADDHTCSGTTFDAPYYAVEPSPLLFKACIQAVEHAMTDLRKSVCCHLDISIRTKLVGNAIFELLELVKEVGETVIRRLKMGMGAVYAIALTSALLRGLHLL